MINHSVSVILEKSMDTTNPYLQKIISAWPHLKPWQKASIFIRAMYWLYLEKIKQYLTSIFHECKS